MSVTQTDTVDFISLSPEQEVVLTISDHLSWNEADHHSLLENKINTYLRFIKSEQLLDAYPAATARPVIIQLTMQFEPTEDVLTVLRQAKEVILGEDIGFRWGVLSE